MRAGRSPRCNRLKQHLGGGAGGTRRPALATWTRETHRSSLGWSRSPDDPDSWTIPRSCGPRHEAELGGEERERRETAGAAGAARRDRTAAGLPAGDALNNRGEEAARPRKPNLLAIHGKAQSREQRRPGRTYGDAGSLKPPVAPCGSDPKGGVNRPGCMCCRGDTVSSPRQAGPTLSWSNTGSQRGGHSTEATQLAEV
ncbi:hypothetical protein NDU88_007754 [Pleurodeles waltl]|uniref:Uncharacterized protein n=1 Tax=Pleurodeles waltl TaxID=8319 RepID=A0AAV7RST9_PLEWA|nr:hypothetical protein NDU88_007754 [Pleurodeles waltl]